MTTSYVRHFPSTRKTPQSEPIRGREQVQDNAGGFTFEVDDFSRLDRFLILGAEGGTYYAGERELTVENANCVLRCAQVDPVRTVNRIVEISDTGRAPKNDPAIFALALIAGLGSEGARTLALMNLNKVCRIGTHLFQFVQAVKELRGFGRQLRTAIGNWYYEKSFDDLAYQLVKYQSRGGMSHRDVLRMCHAGKNTPIFRYAARLGCETRSVHRHHGHPERTTPIVTYPRARGSLPPIIEGFEAMKLVATAGQAACLIEQFDLPHECVPTEFLTDPAVWDALLIKMPITALIRNLATMTRVGLLAPMSSALAEVVRRLDNEDDLAKSRVHPIALLAALKTYAQGHGERGTNTWNPVSQVVDAIDGAFYKAFGNVPVTGKRWLIACDVSGSMASGEVSGIAGLSPRVATGALALVTAAVEPLHHIVAFTANGRCQRPSQHRGYPAGITPLAISPRQRLDDVCRMMGKLPMGGTDCALPMIYAQEERLPVDVFVILTDNETWAGDIHPCQALRSYRQATGINAKLIVNAMTPTEFSIADSNDAGTLDVVGFDAATPQVMSSFAVE